MSRHPCPGPAAPAHDTSALGGGFRVVEAGVVDLASTVGELAEDVAEAGAPDDLGGGVGVASVDRLRDGLVGADQRDDHLGTDGGELLGLGAEEGAPRGGPMDS